jgi:hypothetical protein
MTPNDPDMIELSFSVTWSAIRTTLVTLALVAALIVALCACQDTRQPASSCDSPARHAAQGGTTGVPPCHFYV